MQPMRRFTMHSQGVQFFPFWRGGGVGYFVFFLLSMCSHRAPIRFPTGSSRGSQQHLSFTPYGLPKVNSHLYEKVQCKGAHLFLFCDWGPKRCFYSGSAQCSKKIDDGPMNVAPSKKKSCEGTHELINLNHTQSYSNNQRIPSIKWGLS